jgi:hypothetical protein
MCVQRMTDPKKMERQSCRSAEIMARKDLFTMDSLIHVPAKLGWRMWGLKISCRNGDTRSTVLFALHAPARFLVLGRFVVVVLRAASIADCVEFGWQKEPACNIAQIKKN